MAMLNVDQPKVVRAGFGRTELPLVPPKDEALAPLANVIEQLRHEFAADGVIVAWHDGTHDPTLLFASGACVSARGTERELERAAPLAAAASDGLAYSTWVIGEEDAASALTTVIPTGGATVTITVLFERLSVTTRAHVREYAVRMVPMMEGFFGLWGLRAIAVARLKGLTAAINSSDAAVLLIDEDGRLIFANDAAEGLLAQADGLRRSGGTIGAGRLSDTMRLQAAIEHVIAGIDPCETTPVIALQRRSGRALIAAIVRADPATAGAGAVVYVFDPGRDLLPLIAPVCKLYGLSPVETRLACLLADGMALVEAAEKIRVREQTARSYLKQIFMKTDTNRQAELVWLMLKSSVRVASAGPMRSV